MFLGECVSYGKGGIWKGRLKGFAKFSFVAIMNSAKGGMFDSPFFFYYNIYLLFQNNEGFLEFFGF